MLRNQPLPSIRELAGFLGINPNTVARAIEDLKQSGYVEARRGRRVFVASTLPTRTSPTLRGDFLKDTVIRAAALGMTPHDVTMGVLSVAGVRLAARRGAAEILLVECSPAELDFFAQELEAQLPVRVDKVLLSELADAVRRRKSADDWRAAVTSFGHLPGVERLLEGRGVPVLALLAEAHLETLHRLAQFLRRGRGSGWSPLRPKRPTTWSTRSPMRPCRTLRGSRPARSRAPGWLGWYGGWTSLFVPPRQPSEFRASSGPCR